MFLAKTSWRPAGLVQQLAKDALNATKIEWSWAHYFVPKPKKNACFWLSYSVVFAQDWPCIVSRTEMLYCLTRSTPNLTCNCYSQRKIPLALYKTSNNETTARNDDDNPFILLTLFSKQVAGYEDKREKLQSTRYVMYCSLLLKSVGMLISKIDNCDVRW